MKMSDEERARRKARLDNERWALHTVNSVRRGVTGSKPYTLKEWRAVVADLKDRDAFRLT